MVCTLLAGVNVVAFAAEADDELTDSVSVLRAYNPNNSEHLYTIDETEYNANVSRGYQGEGEAWKAPIYSETEVWRAYNPNSGEHMLASEAEVYALEAAGWQNEGFKMYSDDDMGTPIYRVFNPNSNDAGSHHYCGYEEAAGLVDLGWEWDNDGEPVIYGVEEEQPVILVNLTDADQISAKSIYVEFDQDASLLVDKDDITVEAADGTLSIPVLNMTFDEDGMGATLDLSIALQDAKDYVISLNDSEVELTASVGEVATIALKTASAQQNVETPIEFALFDEMGVDVTSTVNVDSYCTVTVDSEGDVSSDTSKASKSTITMNEVGEIATVTISYNNGNMEEDITTTGVVTCIEPEAVVGMGIYYDVPTGKEDQYINQSSGCSKFYWRLIQTSPVQVEENESDDNVFFSAVDENLMPIEYDSYTVESSNDDVMNVTSDTDAGKFVKMTVTGNAEGTANVVITATKNGKDTAYTIPVTVTTEGYLKNVKITTSRSTMSNAYDEDYYGEIEVTAYDNNGREITDFNGTYDVANADTKSGEADIIEGLDGTVLDFDTTGDGGFQVLGLNESAIYTAYGSKGGTRTVNVEISKDDKVITRPVNIKVTPIANTIWNDGLEMADANLTYSVEIADSTLDATDDKAAAGQAATVVRLAAKYGSAFVGYVRDTDSDGDGNSDAYIVGTNAVSTTSSAINVSATTQLSDVCLGIKYGSLYSQDGALYNFAVNNALNTTNNAPYTPSQGAQDATLNVGGAVVAEVTAATMAGRTPDIDSVVLPNDGTIYALNYVQGVWDTQVLAQDAITAYLDASNSSLDYWFAKPGQYTVEFKYTINGKSATNSSKLTVKNSFTAMQPIVNVNARVVDNIAADTSIIEDALTTMTDMNNNISMHESIKGLYGVALKQDTIPPFEYNGDVDHDFTAFTDLDQTNNRVTVKYACVEDQVGSLSGSPVKIKFMVPINTTFRMN